MLAESIEDRISYLSSLTRNMKRYLRSVPDGSLYFSKAKGHTYPAVRTKLHNGRYQIKHMDPENTPLLQTYYDKAICKAMVLVLESELKELRAVDTRLLRFSDQKFFEKSKLLEAYTSNEFLHYSSQSEKWASEPYPTNSRPIAEQSQFKTITGVIVRSKIEKIVADCLTRLGYSYRYEMRVVLKNGEYRYPDFAVYSPYTGRILWIEVFGMMDEHDYAVSNIQKIKNYGAIGIIAGINFLTVFDLPDVSFDEDSFIKALEHMLRSN